jgi:DNA-binding transcriptional LysR family regulator
VDERNSDVAVREVREGAADLGVVWEAVDAAGVQRLSYRADHLGVVMPPGHPLARRRRVRFADTLDHATVGVSPGGLLDRQVRRQAALLGRDIVQRMQVSSLDAGVRIVAAGLGVAILPFEASSAQVAASGLVMLPLAEPWAERRFVILAREDPWLTATARLLLSHLASRAGNGGADRADGRSTPVTRASTVLHHPPPPPPPPPPTALRKRPRGGRPR